LIEEGSAEYDQEKSIMDTSQMNINGNLGVIHQDSDPYGQTMADQQHYSKVNAKRKT